MSGIENLIEAINETGEQLYAEALVPDPSRRDWGRERDRVDALVGHFEQVLVPALEGARAELDDEGDALLSERVADFGLGVFAVLLASGDEPRSHEVLRKASELSSGTTHEALIAAAGRDNQSAVELCRLRHRKVNGHSDADAGLKKLAKSASDKAFATEALELVHAPKPVTSAPSLGTMNGIGMTLWGDRDRRPDGTHIKTHCFSVLFVPIFPVAAYRVVDYGDSSYGFITKNRLSGFARAYQKLLVASIVGLIGYFAISSYLGSPNRLAGKDFAAAASLAETDREAAIESYEKAIERWSNEADDSVIADASTAVMKLHIAGVPEPFTIENVDHAMRVSRRVSSVPAMHGTEAAAVVADQMVTWSETLGDERADAMNRASELLSDAARYAPPDRLDSIQSKKRALQSKLAQQVASERPLDALALLVELSETEAAGKVVQTLLDKPSLLVEAEPDVRAWAAKSGTGADAALTALTAALERGKAEKRKKALDSRDPKALAAEAKSSPGDVEVAVVIAQLELEAGDAKAAIERLLSFGGPGWLTSFGQQTLAGAYVQAGDSKMAETVLEQLIAFKLPRYRAASTAYNDRADEVYQGLIRRADSGQGPGKLKMAMQSGDDKAIQAAFKEWSDAEMTKNAELAALGKQLDRYFDVVPHSIQLGTVRLQRANEATGAERDALLSGAEKAFLAIRGDAVGVPSYHLGLGQVYHRLGKPDEGNKEFDNLIGRGDPLLTMQVARAYRDLGLVDRATELLETVWKEAPSPAKEQAAHALSAFVDTLELKETWLERSDQNDPEVANSLMQARARRALRDNRDGEAAKLLEKVAAHYEKSATHNSAAANNAAVAYLELYSATGKTAHLARARRGFEASNRLEPDSAIVLGNYASHCDFEGRLAVLEKFVNTSALRLTPSDVDTVVGFLDDGPLRDRYLNALAANPLVRKAAELYDRQRVLAPSNAGPWHAAQATARQRHDSAALRKLLEQVKRVRIETSAAKEAQRAWIAGDNDDLMRQQGKQELERLDSLVDGKLRNKPLAVALLLRGGEKSTLAMLERKAEMYDEVIADLVRAHKLWPELAYEPTLAHVSMMAALLRAASKSDEVNGWLDKNFRKYTATVLLTLALSSQFGDELRAAMAADPAIVAAARALKSNPALEPSMTMWLIATITGDSDLLARADTAFDAEYRLLAAEINNVLSASESQQLLVRMLKNRGSIAAEK